MKSVSLLRAPDEERKARDVARDLGQDFERLRPAKCARWRKSVVSDQKSARLLTCEASLCGCESHASRF